MDQTYKSFMLTRGLLWAMLCFVPVGPANAAEGGSAKRVLIISTGSRFSAGFAVAHERILEAQATGFR